MVTIYIPLTMYREFGAIPVLITQLNYPDLKVQLAVLGALRNLSYGRLNDDNKVCKLLLASTATYLILYDYGIVSCLYMP